MNYVLSDIHGNMNAFLSILQKIQLKPEDTLYVLGDIIDRNEYGIQILRLLMKMDNAKLLCGNHEKMMLDAVGNSGELMPINNKAMDLWIRQNGGDITLNYLKHIKKSIRKEILSYLSDLPLQYKVVIGDKQYLLVHAAPPELFSETHPRYKIYGSKEEFCVWYRLRYYDKMPDCYTAVIFGHSPTFRYQDSDPLRIYYGENRIIGIDCGCGLPHQDSPFFTINGRLGCLRLEDMKEFYSE